jgi:ketosteroid isomerase-like protein
MAIFTDLLEGAEKPHCIRLTISGNNYCEICEILEIYEKARNGIYLFNLNYIFMNKTYIFIAALLIGFYATSCNSKNSEKSPNPNAEIPALDKQWAKSFIDSVNAKFSDQIASGDSSGLASQYWPDAELLLDNSEVVKGKDILNAWGSAIRMGIKEMTFSTTDITGSPALIIETGNFEMKDAKNTLIDRGKYVVVWQKRNGEWKLYRDIGNTSMPAAK